MVSENNSLIEEIERQAQAYWDFMTQEEREQYAWLAGIVDGEGSIVIARHKGYLLVRLSVRMTDKPTIDYIHNLTGRGGGICRLGVKDPKRHRPYYKWEASGAYASSVLRRCLPFLHTKRLQAILATEFTELQKLGGQGRYLNPAQLAKRQEIRARMSQLNRGEVIPRGNES